MKSQSQLLKSYDDVFKKFTEKQEINQFNLKNSLDIFEDKSIENRKLIPKKLEVIGVISGLPFDLEFVRKIQVIQFLLSGALSKNNHYMVKPNNLAVEYCVIKWPDDDYDKSMILKAKNVLEKIKFKKFNFVIHGVQVHTDGCIILKGVSEKMVIHQIRDLIKESIPNLPKRQSSWSHVPIGRFVEPLNLSEKKSIDEFLTSLNSRFFPFSTHISNLYLIHEHRWYMEEFTRIYEKTFS